MFVSVLVVLSCTTKPNKPNYQAKPAMRISPIEVSATRGTFLIECINADKCHLLNLESSKGTPTSEKIITEGIETKAGEYILKDLSPEKDYTLYGVASDSKGQTGKITSLSYSTVKGPKELYDWEKDRDTKPRYSNLALCYGGSGHRVPEFWDKERFSKHVTYIDENGKEHWLFDGFLAIEFTEAGHGHYYDYALGYGRPSANKDSWTRLMDYWFDDELGFGALNKAVEEAANRIGTPPTSRKVIITLPDPIIYQSGKDATSSTTYWGFIDGKMMNFSKAADRQTALKWYIDEVRQRWNRANYPFLEFMGFYIVSEDLATPGYGWSPELKHWEDIYPEISRYIHACNETLNWIPYNSAGGYQNWKKFEIDYVMMQPNYFWHPEYDMTTYKAMVLSNGLSMEFELDEKILEKNTGSYGYRQRFYEYMSICKDLDLYKKRELSYYFGTNDFYELSTSTYPLDKKLYNDLCEFIIGHIH